MIGPTSFHFVLYCEMLPAAADRGEAADGPMDQAAIELIKAGIAVAGVVVVALMARKRGGRNTMVAAGLLAAISAAAFLRFGNFHWPRFLHNWDLYHYYLGAKYFDELGYYDLYRCTLEADEELGRSMLDVTEVRDLRSLEYTTPEALLDGGSPCRERFGEARWAEFRQDVRFFCDITPDRLWARILVDKGYNGTPPWTRYAGALASWAGTSEPWRLHLVCAIDEILLAIMLLGVLWAFGPRTFVIATIFFGVNFATRWQHVGGSLLRMDWLATLVLALCALKRDRPLSAGLLLSHAAAARVFPVLFAAGLVVEAAAVLITERRVDRKTLRFGVGLVAGLALFFVLGATGPRGMSAWTDFAANISAHSAAPAGKRIGLKYVILPMGRFEADPGDANERNTALRERWERRRPIAFAAAAVALVLFVLAIRRLRDRVQVFALGVVPVFFLLSPTRYYWAMLLVPVIAWAALDRRWQSETLCTVMLMQALLFLINRTEPPSMVLSTISSFCLLIIFAYVLWSEAGPEIRARLRGARGDPGGEGAEPRAGED